LSHFIKQFVARSNMYPCRTFTDTASARKRTRRLIKTTYTLIRAWKANMKNMSHIFYQNMYANRASLSSDSPKTTQLCPQ